MGPISVRTRTATHGGRTSTWRLAVHHLGSEAAVDTFAEMTWKVVAEQVAMWGEPAGYDFGTYTFIADYLPWASGDGMEHRNSTVVTSSRSLTHPQQRLDNLGTVSHELFHSWNVERLRPQALEPFDFERENMSGELWFAEGFTSYYDALFIRRAGIFTDEQYAEDISGNVNTVITAPGRRRFSAVEMSMQAPFVDAAVSIDPHNRGNTFISYYTWGAAVAMGLDLTLRSRFEGVTLDDYMRAVWRRHGAQRGDLAPARPYTRADLVAVLGEVTGDTAFAADFFRRYVEGREVPDYAALAAHAGLLLRPAAPGRAWLGAAFRPGEGGAEVATYPLRGGALHDAGITAGDVIVSGGGRPTPDPASLTAAVAEHAPGERVAVEWISLGRRRSGEMTLAANPAVELVTHESAGRELTDAMRRFRQAWLGGMIR